MVFAKNELGQANIITEDGELSEGVSNVVIHGWFNEVPTMIEDNE